ncbi:MAG: transcriptional repressor [Candidatus Izimaplasma sp.]|nr:transcriptional repressor [Candidatus Izimaplasma bacterium]
MDEKERLFQKLRKQNIRITKQRKAIINVLEDKHLTIQEIHARLKEMGFNNLGTVYNNIDFLLEHKIVTQLFINGKKHYDLTIDDTKHNADSHIHVTCKINNNIIEINHSDIFNLIKQHPIFKDFKIDKLQLLVEGHCEDNNQETCKKDGKCFINTLGKAHS